MRIKTVFLLAVALLGLALNLAPAEAQAGTAEDLIREVNRLRASQGAAPLQASADLSEAAQAHAEYLASIGYLTHTGPGSSRPRDRAVAAGYGGGAVVFVAENIAVGRDMSPGYTVETIWADSDHRSTMLNPQNTHAGAGVALNGGQVYYVLVTGFIAGQPGPSTAAPTAEGGATTLATETAAPTTPAQTSTPQPDGSILYEVQPGDTLWSIAIAHNIKIEDIQQYNNLGSSDVVWAGQELFVAPTYTPTLEPTETNTPLPPTRTPRPTSTPRPTALAPSPTAAQPMLTETEGPAQFSLPSFERGSSARRNLAIGIIVICAVGLVIVLAGGLKKS